jgi:hypothetical protein
MMTAVSRILYFRSWLGTPKFIRTTVFLAQKDHNKVAANSMPGFLAHTLQKASV